ncbi:hypothetical protein R3P38DRAFT_2801920 [Favolaschia claudopus]|uniref:Uncharacterized protein n=1 Tax=Favolaschia claudopus TaxID=2862362 RepID=A0AAV9ZVH2_9AGAR
MSATARPFILPAYLKLYNSKEWPLTRHKDILWKETEDGMRMLEANGREAGLADDQIVQLRDNINRALTKAGWQCHESDLAVDLEIDLPFRPVDSTYNTKVDPPVCPISLQCYSSFVTGILLATGDQTAPIPVPVPQIEDGSTGTRLDCSPMLTGLFPGPLVLHHVLKAVIPETDLRFHVVVYEQVQCQGLPQKEFVDRLMLRTSAKQACRGNILIVKQSASDTEFEDLTATEWELSMLLMATKQSVSAFSCLTKDSTEKGTSCYRSHSDENSGWFRSASQLPSDSLEISKNPQFMSAGVEAFLFACDESMPVEVSVYVSAGDETWTVVSVNQSRRRDESVNVMLTALTRRIRVGFQAANGKIFRYR